MTGHHRTEAARIERWRAMGPSPLDRLDPHPHRDMYPAPGYTDTYRLDGTHRVAGQLPASAVRP